MSRIGRKPISVPPGVEVTLEGKSVRVKGPKGVLELYVRPSMRVSIADGHVMVEKLNHTKQAQAMWGTMTKLISNMIAGVTAGFSRQLELNGVGYRMNLAGQKLTLALGFSHPVVVIVPDGIEARIENNLLTFVSIDKQKVGQFAAEVRGLKPVEPYKGKGFRYAGEKVRRKEGKKTAA